MNAFVNVQKLVIVSSDAGVLNISLRFPVTQVPSDETTYICQGFYLPNDTDYHVIGSTPIINNSDVIHHMLLYACKDMPCETRIF